VTAPAIRKPRWPLALAIVCAIAAGTVTWAWNTDSGYYAFLPDKAHPTAPIITVPGEKPQAPGAGREQPGRRAGGARRDAPVVEPADPAAVPDGQRGC